MKGFLSALQFLTVIPLGREEIDEKRLSQSVIYFPLIGLILGFILVGANELLYILAFDKFLINTTLVILLVILTGGLHLDGLADTSDALLSGKNREEMLKIMRDPHIATMGVLALIGAVLIKISLLLSLNPSIKNVSLFLMCLLSRYSLVLAMQAFSYARQEGKAKLFMDGTNTKIFLSATIITLFCAAVIWKIKGICIFAVMSIFAFIVGTFIKNKIGGMTGDTLGAINELTEIATLFSIYTLEKLWAI